MVKWPCTLFNVCANICRNKICKESFFNRVASHSEEKVGNRDVLSREHNVHVVVLGLNKATMSMHCYFSASRLPQSRCFKDGLPFKWPTIPSITSMMKMVIDKTCWLNYVSTASTSTVSGIYKGNNRYVWIFWILLRLTWKVVGKNELVTHNW